MKLKRFFVDKILVESFQEMKDPSSAAFVISTITTHNPIDDCSIESASVEFWDGDTWQTIACVPPHNIECENMLELVLAKLSWYLDHPLEKQIFHTYRYSDMYSQHFEPTSDMKDIAL